MTRRKKKQLAIIFLICSGLGFISLGAFWFFVLKNPQRNVSRALAALEEDNIRGAISQYGSALRKEPRSEFAFSAAEIYNILSPETLDVAINKYREKAAYIEKGISLLFDEGKLDEIPSKAYDFIIEMEKASYITGYEGWLLSVEPLIERVLKECNLTDLERSNYLIYRSQIVFSKGLKEEENPFRFESGKLQFLGQEDLLEAMQLNPSSQKAWGAFLSRRATFQKRIEEGQSAMTSTSDIDYRNLREDNEDYFRKAKLKSGAIFLDTNITKDFPGVNYLSKPYIQLVEAQKRLADLGVAIRNRFKKEEAQREILLTMVNRVNKGVTQGERLEIDRQVRLAQEELDFAIQEEEVRQRLTDIEVKLLRRSVEEQLKKEDGWKAIEAMVLDRIITTSRLSMRQNGEDYAIEILKAYCNQATKDIKRKQILATQLIDSGEKAYRLGTFRKRQEEASIDTKENTESIETSDALLTQANVDLEDAKKILDNLSGLTPEGITLFDILKFQVVPASHKLLGDIAFIKWNYSDNESNRTDLILAIESSLDKISSEYANVSQIAINELRGKVNFARANYSGASEQFEKAIKGYEQTPPISLLRLSAQSLRQIGALGASRDRYEQLLERNPRNAEALVAKIQLDFELGNFESARAALQQIPEEARNKSDQLSQLWRTIATQTPVFDPIANKIKDAMQRVEEYFIDKDIESARRELLKLLNDPTIGEDPRILLSLSELESSESRKAKESGDTEAEKIFKKRALEYIDRAIALQPESKRLKVYRAVINESDFLQALESVVFSSANDEVEKAVQMYTQLKSFQEKQSSASLQYQLTGDDIRRKESTERAKRAEEASISWFNKLKKYNTEFAALKDSNEINENDLRKYQLVQMAIWPEEISEALRTENWERGFNVISKMQPIIGDSLAAYQRARVHFSAAQAMSAKRENEKFEDQLAQCIQECETASELRPFDTDVWFLYGLAYELRGDLKQSHVGFEKAYEADPSNERALRKYVRSLIEQDPDSPQALRILESARSRDASDIVLRNAYWELLENMGRSAEMIQERLDHYVRKPGDIDNALQLGVYLAQAFPEYVNINADSNGNVTSEEWSFMKEAKRQSMLADLKNKWRKTADIITEQFSNEKIRSTREAVLKAKILLSRKPGKAAFEFLKEFEKSIRSESFYSRAVRACGALLVDSGQRDLAIEFIKSSEPNNESDYELIQEFHARLWFDSQQFKEAGEIYEELLSGRHIKAPDFDPDVDGEFIFMQGQGRYLPRYIVCMSFLNKFEVGKKAINKLKELSLEETATAPIQQVLVQTMMYEQMALQAQSSGDLNKFKEMNDLVDRGLEEAIQLDPRNPIPYLRRARASFKRYITTRSLSDLESAQKFLDKVEEVSDQMTDPVRDLKAQIHIEAGEQQRAVSLYLNALELNPSRGELRRRLATLYRSIGDIEGSVKTIKSWLDLQGEPRTPAEMGQAAEWYMLIGDLCSQGAVDMPRAIRSYIKSINYRPNDSNVSKLLRASTLESIEKALNEYGREIQFENNDDFKSVYPLIDVFEAKRFHVLGDRSRSEASLRKAYQNLMRQYKYNIDNPNPLNIRYLMQWYVSAGKILKEFPLQVGLDVINSLVQEERTIYKFGKAAFLAQYEVEPEYSSLLNIKYELAEVTALMELGGIFVSAGYSKESVDLFKHVLQIDPKNFYALNNLSYLLSEEMNLPEEALTYAQKANEMRPQNSSILDTLSAIYLRLGNVERARDLLLQCLSIDQQNVTTLRRLAVIYIDSLGMKEDAILHAERASRLAPTDSKVQSTLGYVYYKSGDPGMGLKMLRESKERNLAPLAYFYEGKIYLDDDKTIKACESFKESLQRALKGADKDSETARKARSMLATIGCSSFN